MQLSDKKYLKRLKDFGLSLVTVYKSGNKTVEKNSFETLKENIVNGIRLEKNYIRGGKSVFKLFNFDPRIKYTFMIQLTNRLTSKRMNGRGTNH